MPPVGAGIQGGNWNPSTHRLTISGVEVIPGNTLVLILTSQGSYAGVDEGPLPGQYDTTVNLLTQLSAELFVGETRIFCDGRIADWPDPTVVGPYLGTLQPGLPFSAEQVLIVNVAVADFYVDVERGPTEAEVNHPPESLFIVNDPVSIVDSGNPPPLLYVPGDPTAAPARTTAWWAQVNAAGSVDPSFSLWQSRYWQSAPTLPAGHPLWSTLSMVARRVDGTEMGTLIDPVTHEMIVEMQGAIPTDYTFLHAALLLQMSPTIEILPIPESFGDIMQGPDPALTVPPDPRSPPFAWNYPRSNWTRWISSLGMNGVDIFLPILLSQSRIPRYPISVPRPGIRGFHDATGVEYDPANPDLPFDNPVPLVFEAIVGKGGGLYSVDTQVGYSVFNTTHNPNPIIDELVQVGDVQLAIGGVGAGYGTSRVPVIGQHPWWELASLKLGNLEVGGTSVQPPTGDVRTGDVMVVVAQSNGVGAPADPEGWTRVDALCGPNAQSGEPVTIHTALAQTALAGATTMGINLYDVTSLPPAPLTVVCEGETLTATSYALGALGNIELTLAGPVGVDHLAPAAVDITSVTPVVGQDQYVGVWWKIAEGPPPIDGAPAPSTDAGPTINFPDGTRCSARLYAVVCDLTNPFSQLSLGVDACSRLDIPAPALFVQPTDLAPEDGITLRAAIGLLMGDSAKGSEDVQHQDIDQQTVSTGALGLTVDGPPILQWDSVGPDTVGCALYLIFRGYRDRPLYEKVDGHYAPTWDNRGALPPCAGTTGMSSDDYRLGFGIRSVSAHTATGVDVIFQKEEQWGSTAYLHAWLWSDTSVPDVTGYIYQRSATGAIINEHVWFDASPTGFDHYIDPPADPQFYTGDNPYCVRIEIHAGSYGTGLLGINAWSEEFCQDPAVASFGLAAGFRFRGEAPPASPSNQQPSIVG